MVKYYDFYLPLFFSNLFEDKVSNSLIYGRHSFICEIWTNHIKVDKFFSIHAKDVRRWIKRKEYDFLYDSGFCMIYIKLNNQDISYLRFMEGKYFYA